MATKDGKKTGGRQKGTPNKATLDARDTIARLGFNPVEAMVHWATGNWQALGYDKGTKTIYSAEGMPIEVDRIDEQLRQKSTKDLLPYVCPQLKAVELSAGDGENPFASFAQLVAGLVKENEQSTKEDKPPRAEASNP